MYPELNLLISTAHEAGYSFIEVLTNGTSLTPAHVKFFSQLGVQTAVSLYSAERDVHEEITGSEGSFELTMGALEMLREANIPTRVALVVMRQNQHTVEQTINFIETSGFIFHGPKILKGIGRGAKCDLQPDAEIIERWAVRRRPQFRTDPELFTRYQTCNPCWGRELAVSSEGLALPCIFARNLSAGDLKKESLQEVLASNGLSELRRITKDVIEVCQDCEYRYACGDCRISAYGQTGNLYAKTPLCGYDPRKGVWEQKAAN